MSVFGKALVLFSLLAVLIAAAAAQAPLPATIHGTQHAGCHQPTTKTPAPVSYRCCQSGHDSLLLLNSGFVHSSAQIVQFARMPVLAAQPSVPGSSYTASPPNEWSAPLSLRI